MFAIEYGGDEEIWRIEARCADGAASLTALFFSEALDDIAREGVLRRLRRAARSASARPSPGASRGACGAASSS